MAQRRIRDPEARERIVTAAREEVGARGLRGATVRAIANRAGVSTGFVMHYFPDKPSLYRSVLEQNNRLADARVRAASDDQRGNAAISAVVRALLPVDEERRLEWRVWSAFWAEAGKPSDERDAGDDGLAAAFTGLVERLRSALEEAEADGEVAEGIDPRLEAERIVAMAAGLGLLAGVGPSGRLSARAEQMVDAHLADLGRRAPQPAT